MQKLCKLCNKVVKETKLSLLFRCQMAKKDRKVTSEETNRSTSRRLPFWRGHFCGAVIIEAPLEAPVDRRRKNDNLVSVMTNVFFSKIIPTMTS